MFYAPVYFNRNNSHLFNTLFKTCDEKNISYLFVEEIDYAKKYDFNLKGKRADFFVLLVVLVRKMIKSKEIINKDRLIENIYGDIVELNQKTSSFYHRVW